MVYKEMMRTKCMEFLHELNLVVEAIVYDINEIIERIDDGEYTSVTEIRNELEGLRNSISE